MKLGGALTSVGLLCGLGVLLVVAWHSAERWEASRAPACSCELERTRSGWCEACRKGWVGATEIPSQALYDALDPHGHDVDVPGLACASCKEAARSDGYCARHARGFVGGRAYLSRLSYHVARREEDEVQDELGLLATAVETIARCELCAAAMVIDGTCPKCRLSYDHGRASPAR